MTRHKNQPNRTPLRTGLPAIFLIFSLLSFPTSVFATTCGCWISLDTLFDGSDAVFTGTVVEVNDKGYGFAKFNVEKIWKGVSEKKVILQGQGLCDDTIETNKRYLVFADKSESDGRLKQRGCLHVRPVKDMDVVFRVLNFMARGIEEKKIFEEIFEIAQSHKKLSYQVQAVKLILSVYGQNPARLPKDAAKILKELEKNPDPELSGSARGVLEHIDEMKRKANPEHCIRFLTPGKEYHNNETVFLGRAISIENKREWGNDTNIARFEVEKAWKGVEGKKVELTFKYWGQFEKGKRYLVYADDGYDGLESLVCHGTKIAGNVEMEMKFLDKLVAGMEEKKIFKWLLATAQTHHESGARRQALVLVDSVFGVSTPDIPEGMEEALKNMAEDPNYEHRQYAQTILDKIKQSKKNRSFLP